MIHTEVYIRLNTASVGAGLSLWAKVLLDILLETHFSPQGENSKQEKRPLSVKTDLTHYLATEHYIVTYIAINIHTYNLNVTDNIQKLKQ